MRCAPLSRASLPAGMIVLAAVASGCTYNPVTGRSQLLMLSPQQEVALGEEAAPQLVAEYGGEVEAPALAAYVERVGQAVAARVEDDAQALPWRFVVLDTDVINAFALPGGKVFISRGLMARLDSEAQLAGVLGHEIGHVTAQHVDERISQALLLELGVTALGSVTDSELALYGARLFSGGYQLKFGRDQESEADRLGVRYMAAAGYAPSAMLEVLEVLAEAAAAGGPRPPEFLSTHPHPETRIRTVERLLAGPYRHTLDNPAFRHHRQRYEQEARPWLASRSRLDGRRGPPGGGRRGPRGDSVGAFGPWPSRQLRYRPPNPAREGRLR